MRNIYRRYFKVTTGPMILAIQKHREVMNLANSEYKAICKEVGADVDSFFRRDGKLVGFIFSGPDPCHLTFKKGKYGWTPRKNTKMGKHVCRQVAAVKTSDLKECLATVGLTNTFARIFDSCKAYSATIIDVPASPPWALMSVPWYDENPEIIAQYIIDRADGRRCSANLAAIMWEPSPDMIEIKEWQYKKEIDDWKESIKNGVV